MNKLTLIAFSFSLPFISACTPSMPTLPEFPSLPDMPDILPDISLPTLYKDDIQQGSVLDRFKINQLKVGMSKAQVQDLIGSPSIIDPFHNNQWDYINHSTLHEKDDVHYRLALSFDNDKLTKIDTSGIESLSALTDKEKALEEKRIADEKTAIEALKKAKIQAQQLAKEKAQAIEQKRIADEKAQAEASKKKTELAQIKQAEITQQNAIKAAEIKQQQADELAQQKVMADKKANKTAAEKIKKDEETPWYKFW